MVGDFESDRERLTTAQNERNRFIQFFTSVRVRTEHLEARISESKWVRRLKICGSIRYSSRYKVRRFKLGKESLTRRNLNCPQKNVKM